MEEIRVLHVIDSLAAGGAERVLIETVNQLRRVSFPVGVCVTRSEMQLASQLAPEIPVLVLKRRSTWDLKAMRRLSRYCQENGVAVLHAHGRSSAMFCAVIKLLGHGRSRLLFHDHFGDIAVDSSASLPLRLVSRHLVDRYVAVDPALQAWAVGTLGLDRASTSVLGNAIDLTRFDAAAPRERSARPSVKQPLVAAVVANLRPQKDHPMLLRAFARARGARERLHVVLIGLDANDPYSRECHQLVRELGLEENVSFLGSREDVAPILREVDFGLLSSRSESGPVTLLEYIASGLPFVVTQTGQITEAIRSRGIGLFVPPGNTDAYALALEQLMSLSEEERREMGRQGRQIAADCFSIERQVEQLVGLYAELGAAECMQPV